MHAVSDADTALGDADVAVGDADQGEGWGRREGTCAHLPSTESLGRS